MDKKQINDIFNRLSETYGQQGWWPLLVLKDHASDDHLDSGYHPGDYSFPHSPEQVFEICIGAILTQNTSWIQAEKALHNLHNRGLLSLEGLGEIEMDTLIDLIKPAGYFNQKAKKINQFTIFYRLMNGDTPKRQDLLSLWGIGPETADSMLLYAFKQSIFVVDAYSLRIFGRIFKRVSLHYYEIQEIFHDVYKNINPVKQIEIFNEYHALLVCHAKERCQSKPLCLKCNLNHICLHGLRIGEKNE